MVQVQIGPAIAPQLLPVVAGNPTELDKLEELTEAGQFSAEELEKIKERGSALRNEMETVAKELRNIERDLLVRLAEMDRHLARPLVEETIGELQVAFEVEGLPEHLEQVAAYVLERLDEFREQDESRGAPAAPAGREGAARFRANVVVDNARTKGRPIIWETAPSYRNLFGTIEMTRSGGGEWITDHTRIRSGSLLRANGGILVIDAMDLLVEPGVWAALKRTLRNRKVEIQAFDPMNMLAGVSMKPEPVPIDVKVVMIGTSHIYRLLHAVDEDFKKVFKVKAEFAVHTPLNEDEILNYACFVHKKVTDDELLSFHRAAVAAVVEEGVRLAGQHGKLTTRFKDIADLIRESGYWAAKDNARWVRDIHVDKAVAKRAYRVNLIEEMMRERMAQGSVLIDLAGAVVGQVNGLAVLDLGDHAFAQPSRITATAAMGRSGIINIDREAELSGPTHTKGVFILTGFLRERFARDKPLTLTASLCFEQGYGPIDGDSASSTELYALLSTLSGVPIRQGIAVTGSVNQRGEIQPIGGANEKIEGYFELCRMKGLTGDQGVMIPTRNVNDLMLRKDLIAEVRRGKFHIYAVSTIEEGLETLTGVAAGARGADGAYPLNSLFGKVDAELTRLAEEVVRFLPTGPA
jgi:ATP-dependent Lon protease